MSVPEMKYVLREMGPAAREFYARLARGELATTSCDPCGELRFPPRERCPTCGGEPAWRTLSGRGVLYAYTQQQQGLRFLKPDVVGVVALEEGVRVFGKIEAPFEELQIGQAVEARTAQVGEITLLEFVRR